jgi:hypothetical protein
MRKVVAAVAAVVPMVFLATPVSAAPQTGACTVRRYSAGVSQCSFLLNGTSASLWLWEAVGDSSATMVCTVGAASRETTGQTYFTGAGQCIVTVYVWSTPGDGLATGNAHLG